MGLLVFVDEINARLEGQHVYDAFLAPLEEGVYVRGGNTFHIAPCFWIFAGTRRPSPERAVSSTEAEDKASDFESRLTAPPFPLSGKSGNPRDQESAALEKVYIGAATIQRFFPDVGSVSSAVLDAIHRLPPDITPRAIAQFVKRFRNIQYGIVTASNLPVNWQQDYTVEPGLFLEWKRSYPGEEEEDMIDLESKPTSDLQGDQEL